MEFDHYEEFRPIYKKRLSKKRRKPTNKNRLAYNALDIQSEKARSSFSAKELLCIFSCFFVAFFINSVPQKIS
jgi:hypothetical protein